MKSQTKSQMKNHKPCKYRKRETRDGVTLDWCYAIGCCEVGDMPCEYCNEKDWGKNNGKEDTKD